MAKLYRIKAARNHPPGRPYVAGSIASLTFTPKAEVYCARDAFNIFRWVTKVREECLWEMEPADE